MNYGKKMAKIYNVTDKCKSKYSASFSVEIDQSTLAKSFDDHIHIQVLARQ